MTSVTSTSLQELIDRADARGLAAAGLACLDRCLPLLAPDGADVLRPVWATVARGDGGAWGEAVAKARVELGGAAAGPGDEAAVLVRGMLDGAPADWAEEALREWARSCSEAALAAHARHDATEAGPLHAGELLRQQTVLEAVAHGPTGLRRARDLSTEGGRVLRAVVSRRARTA
ncbi:hypothetical protein [Streptomyces roseicoloratus]|uniref:HEAT repeat domain-containing protein n=1 Tax=Streptomyces roseicoloratus TaxID=2508722 RepID=A0ABY9RTX1_9ACTN|nr:hypothetical protein [Streptomyces roseicoloratus]WMX45410.1 hypothetical protein RGF97_11860 [Streptomyces roseicoloratus]